MAARLTGAEDVLLLNNGCLCCSVRGDLVRMLGDLCRTKRARFDHVLIETTGLADPVPIIQTFYVEQARHLAPITLRQLHLPSSTRLLLESLVSQFRRPRVGVCRAHVPLPSLDCRLSAFADRSCWTRAGWTAC